MKKLLTGLALMMALVLSTTASMATESNRVLMKTNMGNIVLQLDVEKAPKTVANFLRYVDEAFYNDTIFHRVINGFMIQGGGFDAELERKRTHEPVRNEAKNGLKNSRGTIAMARTNAPHSATAQFFINHADNKNLDYPSFDGWGYAVFGRVVDGMETVDKIADVYTISRNGMGNVPDQTVIIESVTRIANSN